MQNYYLVTTKEGVKNTYCVINAIHPFDESLTVSIIINDLCIKEDILNNPSDSSKIEVIKYLQTKGDVKLISKKDSSDIKIIIEKLRKKIDGVKIKDIKDILEKADKLTKK